MNSPPKHCKFCCASSNSGDIVGNDNAVIMAGVVPYRWQWTKSTMYFCLSMEVGWSMLALWVHLILVSVYHNKSWSTFPPVLPNKFYIVHQACINDPW